MSLRPSKFKGAVSYQNCSNRYMCMLTFRFLSFQYGLHSAIKYNTYFFATHLGYEKEQFGDVMPKIVKMADYPLVT